MRIFTVGLTPRLPPNFVPRALAAVIAAFVCTPNTCAAHAVLSNLVASVGSSSSVGASVSFVALQAGVG
jgi:hypothetical protein